MLTLADIRKIASMQAQATVKVVPALASHREDLEQEALVKMIRVQKKHDANLQKTRPEEWVYMTMTARSACIDYCRKQQKHHTGFRTPAPVTAQTPLDVLVAQEVAEKILDVIVEAQAMMTPREREVFRHRAFGGPAPDMATTSYFTLLYRAKEKVARVLRRNISGEKWASEDHIEMLFKR